MSYLISCATQCQITIWLGGSHRVRDVVGIWRRGRVLICGVAVTLEVHWENHSFLNSIVSHY